MAKPLTPNLISFDEPEFRISPGLPTAVKVSYGTEVQSGSDKVGHQAQRRRPQAD